MARLPNNPLVSELFRAVHGAKTKDKKIELLKQYKRDDVKSILIWNFDKVLRVQFPKVLCLINLMNHLKEQKVIQG